LYARMLARPLVATDEELMRAHGEEVAKLSPEERVIVWALSEASKQNGCSLQIGRMMVSQITSRAMRPPWRTTVIGMISILPRCDARKRMFLANIVASDEQLIREAVEQGRIWALLETVVSL
jgi:hypothetical protein